MGKQQRKLQWIPTLCALNVANVYCWRASAVVGRGRALVGIKRRTPILPDPTWAYVGVAFYAFRKEPRLSAEGCICQSPRDAVATYIVQFSQLGMWRAPEAKVPGPPFSLNCSFQRRFAQFWRPSASVRFLGLPPPHIMRNSDNMTCGKECRKPKSPGQFFSLN